MRVLLHEMSWVEAKRYFGGCDVAIVPVGSNEQHGPPNPLGTDHLIAMGIAGEVARRSGVVCLPVVPFGVSAHHRQFWGTVSVSPRVFKRYVKDVCLSLRFYGVRKILVVNGHGGNSAALADMARELRVRGVFVAVFQWWPATAKLLPGLFGDEERRHAAAEETSMNLVLHPELVDLGVVVDEEPRKHVLRADGVMLPLGTVDESVSGCFGKASSASVVKGRRDFEAVVKMLVRYVGLLKKVRVEDLVEKPKV